MAVCVHTSVWTQKQEALTPAVNNSIKHVDFFDVRIVFKEVVQA